MVEVSLHVERLAVQIESSMNLGTLDVGAAESEGLAGARSRVLEGFSEDRVLAARTVAGDRFWGTAEIAVCPSMIDETVDLLMRG